MELNRNQFLFVAVFIALLGLQLRAVSAYVLTPEATRFLAERARANGDPMATLATTLPSNLPAKVVSPPEWLGWCLLSVGAVLFFHSLTMGRPSGD